MDLIKLFILLKKIKESVRKDLPVIISYLEELQINAFILLSFIFVQFSYIIQIWTSHIQILLFESLLLFPIRFDIPGVFPSNHYIFFPIFLLVFLSILKRMHIQNNNSNLFLQVHIQYQVYLYLPAIYLARMY